MTVRLKPLDQQTIVITGASSGIGLATARDAAKAGARVVLVARNAEDLERIAQEIVASGGQALAVAADVSKREDVERVAREATQRFGGFDTWVNDAAVALYGTMDKVPLEDQRHLFEVNYWGVVYGSLAAAEHLKKRGGALINIGSVLSDRAMIDQGQYSASKHAVRGFTDALRMELEREGAPISVTLIKPAAINTPYPEHARNYMDAPSPAVPPPTYDPHVVARAILHAATSPTRALVVGAGGWAISLFGNLFPPLADLVMELTGKASQTTQAPGRREMRDNLYQARKDGAEHSVISSTHRGSSLLLEAQIRPLTTLALMAGIGFAAFSLLRPTRAHGRDRKAEARQADAYRRYRESRHTPGNGHDHVTQGPGNYPRHDRPAHERRTGH
jgi:short-subunit dehydrogenase